MLFDGAGTATAFWAEQDERVHVAVRPVGGRFRAPDAISNPGPTIESPDYAVAANGDAAVVWSSYGRIVAAVRSSGGGFGPGVLLGATASSVGAPKVAMDPEGNALAVWVERQDDYANGQVRVAFRPAGGGFGPPRTVAEVFYSETYEAEVAMSPTGAATIVWRGGTLRPEFDAGVTALIRSPGGEFGGLERVSSSRPEEAPRVGYDEGGTEYVIWRQYDDQTVLAGRVLAVVRPPGAPFGGQATTVSSMGANVWAPDLATGASGHAIVGWPRGRQILRAEVAEHQRVTRGQPGPEGRPTRPQHRRTRLQRRRTRPWPRPARPQSKPAPRMEPPLLLAEGLPRDLATPTAASFGAGPLVTFVGVPSRSLVLWRAGDCAGRRAVAGWSFPAGSRRAAASPLMSSRFATIRGGVGAFCSRAPAAPPPQPAGRSSGCGSRRGPRRRFGSRCGAECRS